jgi:hypothetical protein
MRTRKLDPIEVRVLGALIEKEVTTPDNYPLTINGVIAACNQKSNRDPVTALSETEVVEALDRLREDVLTWRTDGARVERWQHSLDRRWELSSASKALICLLMLRGPQTLGELKSRSERLHSFADLEEVEATLQEMAGRFDALVEELPRQPGQREARWQHLTLAEEYAEMAPVLAAPSPPPPPSAPPAPSTPGAMERLGALETLVTELRDQVGTLESELLALRRRLGDLD